MSSSTERNAVEEIREAERIFVEKSDDGAPPAFADALAVFKVAAANLNAAWESDQKVAHYPGYLPSFDEFVADLGKVEPLGIGHLLAESTPESEGDRRCPDCAASLDPDQKCASCGAEWDELPDTCPTCDADLEGDTCAICGDDLTEEDESAPKSEGGK